LRSDRATRVRPSAVRVGIRAMANLRNRSGMLLVAMLCTSVAWTACKKEDAKETTVDDACDDYVAAIKKCATKIPGEQRAPIKKQLEVQQDALSKAGPAARKEMADGSRTGLATLRADDRCQ
jgi:hypothetical protein